MNLLQLIEGKPLEKILGIEKLQAHNPKQYVRLLSAELSEKVKQVICCYGYTQIDEPEEREKVADKITKAIGEAIPAPYDVAWPVLKPLVRAIVLELLEKAAERGADFCKNVKKCALLPIVVR